VHSHQAFAAASLAADTNLDRRFGGGNPKAINIFSAEKSTASGAWSECSKRNPCPICGATHWCSTSDDGGAAVCRNSEGVAPSGWRTGKAAPSGGFVLIKIDPLWQPDPVVVLERVRAPKAKAGQKLTTEQCLEILASSRQGVQGKHLARLAEILGVSAEVLEQLGMGWRWGDVEKGKQLHDGDWCYPMRNGAGQVVGVHRRLAKPFMKEGKLVSKLMIFGSTLGLVYAPDHWHQGTGPILCPEGMSDVAALMTMGLAAVGRPSDRAGAEDLSRLLAATDRPIIIVGENDRNAKGRWPGREGAIATAAKVADGLQRPVMWSMVPEPAKDSREWMATAMASGMTAQEAGERLTALLLETATKIDPAPRDPMLDGRLSDSPEVPLDDLRKQMLGRMLSLAQPPLLARCRPDADHPEGQAKLHPGIYLNRGGTGLGKSHAALELAKSLQEQGLRVAFLSLTHEQSRERREEATGMGLVASAADPEITAETCGLYGKARQVRACGLSVQQVLCPTCPLASTCLYQARKLEAKAADVRFACHAQGAQDLGQITAGRDALIIDEDALSAFVRLVQVRPRDLLEVLRHLRTSAKAHPKLVDDETQLLLQLFTQCTERLLAGVRKSSQPGTTRIDTSGLQVPDDSEHVRWGSKLWRLLGHTGQAAPPKEALALLLDVVTGRMDEAWVTHDRHNDGHWDRQLVGIQRHRVPKKLVVMLDATADPDTLERVIQASGTTWTSNLLRAVQVIDPQGKPPAVHEARRIVPVGGDVIVTSRPERCTEVLRGLLDRVEGDRLGLITHGPQLEAMVGGPDAEGGGLLDDHEMARLAKVAGHHTRHVRGSNAWMAGADQQALDALLVIGSPNLPWSQVRLRLLATASFEAAALPDGGWVRHEVLSTTPDGQIVKNPTMAHTDGAWQEARRQLVHAALHQAVGRARHTLQDGCRVYVVTTEPMPGMLTDPVPLQPIDEQTHYLVQQVAALAQTTVEDGSGASRNGPDGPKKSNDKHPKYSSALRAFDGCQTLTITTGDLHTRMAQVGWCQRTTERALARAALLGMLSQPSRGVWALPAQQAAQEPPGSQQEPSEAARPPAVTQAAVQTHRVEARPHTRPAVVVEARCPERPDASSHAVVMATVPEQLPYQPTGQPPDQGSAADHVAACHLVQEPEPPPLPDPAALAWLASSTADEYEQWSERAAIMQHDGGLSRRDAEVLAMGYLFEQAEQRRRQGQAAPPATAGC
jgi:hypothetical protein